MKNKLCSVHIDLGFKVNYDHHDFADAGMKDIAYYDENYELVVVRDYNEWDCVELWKTTCPKWDGELLDEAAEIIWEQEDEDEEEDEEEEDE